MCLHTQGTEVRQIVNSDPGLLVGKDSFAAVEFTGTFFVNTDLDDDFVGLVFNYQSNRRFMLVSWKKANGSYFYGKDDVMATAGLQVKVVKSNTGPSSQLRNALWHSGRTRNQVRT